VARGSHSLLAQSAASSCHGVGSTVTVYNDGRSVGVNEQEVIEERGGAVELEGQWRPKPPNSTYSTLILPELL